MPDSPLESTELLTQLTSAYGEQAVRRALSLVPVLSLLRDDADFHLSTAATAAHHEGVSGTLVLEVPRKPNQPTEIAWHGGNQAVMAVSKSVFK
jgi:hypothetical protein